MKVAVYHNLPPGGARRALWEFLRRTSDVHEYDLYTVDLGRADPFAYARAQAEQQNLTPHAARSSTYPLLTGASTRIPLGKLQPLDAVRRMQSLERRIAADINASGCEVAFVHPCQLTHTPSLLRYLDVPSLHYMQEPRRQTFEAGYRRAARLDWPGSLPRWVATTGLEVTLRRRDRFAAAAADRIACNSQYSAESIQRAYGRTATVCYLGVDTDVFTPASPTQPAGPPSAVSVGALDRVKGHHLVIEALALVPANERPVLHLVYERFDPEYRREVEAVAGSSSVALVLHQGVADVELVDLYRSATVTVVAAQLEPFGLVPLESLACGTPVVAVREAGYRETVEDGVNGYLTERSAPALAEAIQRAMRGGLPASAAALRAGVLSRWAWDSSVKRQLELLGETAACRR